jgi:type II secretory pathway component GspD/PulD (secretin)
MNVQEAQEIATGVQQIMELRRIAVDSGRHILIVRDQEQKVIGARRLIMDMMRLRAQVQVDVELLLVSRNSSLSYGLSLPNMWQALSLQNPIRLSNLGSMATSWFGIGLGQATALANLTRSSTQASLRSSLTALDGQEAQLHIGDQFPIVTGISSFGAQGTTPITQYRDLGLNIRLTPVVQGGGEVSLTMEVEYSGLTGVAGIEGLPLISTRKFNGNVRIKTDEWAVVDGLASSSTSYLTDGIAGLANIPILGHLFRRDTRREDAGQILLILKPRVISEPGWEHPSEPVWMGSETKAPSFY